MPTKRTPPTRHPKSHGPANGDEPPRDNDDARNTRIPRPAKPPRRRGRGVQPPPASAYPPASAVLAQLPDIRQTVVACGVPAHEVDDVALTCLLAAWSAIQRGEFRLHPWVDPAEALRRWLYGIAWRLSTHERDRARHRREVLAENPWALVAALAPEMAVIDPEAEIEARDALRALCRLPAAQRELLLAAALGFSPLELAETHGVSTRTVQLRLERARGDFWAITQQEPGGSLRHSVAAPSTPWSGAP